MSTKVLLLLAPGFEDLEAITVIDLLRRAHLQLTVASLHEDEVAGSRGTRVRTDTSLPLLTRDMVFDMVVLPGGQPGANNLAADKRVIQLLKNQADAGRWLAAVCAAPKVLARAGLTQGKRITHFPGALTEDESRGATVTGEAVEVDGKLVTGRSPGVAMDFALTLIEQLSGKETRDQVEQSLSR